MDTPLHPPQLLVKLGLRLLVPEKEVASYCWCLVFPFDFFYYDTLRSLLGHEVSPDRPIPPDRSDSYCVVRMCYLYPYHLYIIRFCVCALRVVYVYGICRSWVLGSVSMLNKCQNLHMVFNGDWLACYCFYGAVWTIVIYCVMFLSLQNI